MMVCIYVSPPNKDDIFAHESCQGVVDSRVLVRQHRAPEQAVGADIQATVRNPAPDDAIKQTKNGTGCDRAV